MKPYTLAINRSLEKIVRGRATRDGDGVKLTRVLTSDLQQRLDPFLMLDHFGSDDPEDYGGGFPNHPHRGFETVTYMITGRMRHRDSAGHEGLLQSGGVQWMTAGRGVIHSEMPEQEAGVMEGFQLWLNLPARDKMCAPGYRDIPTAEIPEVAASAGVHVRVISGVCGPCPGAVDRSPDAFPSDALFLDIHFNQDDLFEQVLNASYNAFVYPYRGQVHIVQKDHSLAEVGLNCMGILSNEGEKIQLKGAAGTRVLLLAGCPLHEAIAQYGPFVMNTRQELMQAVDDFNNGRLGQ